MNSLRLNEKFNPVISIPNFLSDEEISNIFELSAEIKFSDAGIGSKNQAGIKNLPDKNKLLTDHQIINPNSGVTKRVRETNIKWIQWKKNSDWLFQKIIKCINLVNSENYNYILKFCENLQFSQYTSDTKGFYSKHTDCGNKHAIDNFVDIRKLSFSIQLSSPLEYEGGELKIYMPGKSLCTNKDNSIITKKDKGTIIFFPSDTLHEVTPVTKGTRYSLVSWAQGPNLL